MAEQDCVRTETDGESQSNGKTAFSEYTSQPYLLY